MESLEKDNLVFIRLYPREDIFQSLEEVVKKHDVKSAVVLSGIGMLEKITLAYFKSTNEYSKQDFKEPHELTSLSGTIGKQEDNSYHFHLHATLANASKQVIGGHLYAGTVKVANEIVLMKSNAFLKRKPNEETGLKDLILK